MVRFSIWCVGLVAMLLATYYTYELGWMHALWGIDQSKLSFVNMVVVLVAYLYLGKLTLQPTVSEGSYGTGDYFANLATSLGLLGTVIGFIAMASTLNSIKFTEIEAIQSMIGLATQGLSVAFYTTGSGLVASIIITTAYYALEKSHEA